MPLSFQYLLISYSSVESLLFFESDAAGGVLRNVLDATPLEVRREADADAVVTQDQAGPFGPCCARQRLILR